MLREGDRGAVPKQLAIFLGAGFSKSAGMPLGGELFDYIAGMDRKIRAELAERVHRRWRQWRATHGGGPEQYLTAIQPKDVAWGDLRPRSPEWEEAVRLVGLNIVARLADVNRAHSQRMARHDVFRTTGVPAHEDFWDAIFRSSPAPTVITTNYDILAERGIRAFPHKPGGRRVRPGFHYGFGVERLAGGNTATGYNALGKDPVLHGTVPLLKLHGSVNWELLDSGVRRYFNCWPVIRSTPAIVAPVEGKRVPRWSEPIWTQAHAALGSSSDWLVIGYSLPSYDEQVRSLFVAASSKGTRVHVLDPKRAVAARFKSALPDARVHWHGSFPQGVPSFMRRWSPVPIVSSSARSTAVI